MLRCVDLFAGCGGLSLGFEKAGFEVAAAFDNWQPAVSIYNENFSHPAFMQDLSDCEQAVEKIRAFKPDLLMGGPPCQDFSSAGKRDINGGRADLTYSFANIVCAVKPQWFVMENVEQIKKSSILQDVIAQFTEAGYGLTPLILDASYCGVPQARIRFILIGHAGSRHGSLTQVYSRLLAQRPMTMRDYFGESLGIDYYYRHPRNYNRRGIFSMDEPSPTIRGVNRPIPGGYVLNPSDPPGIALDQVRPLSTNERSWVQTFPQAFRLQGCKTTQEQIIGNAVPVNLAKFVATGIREFLTHSTEPETLFDDVADFFPSLILPERPLHKSA